ncbi:MAG: asparagine synthase-related protein, partial [Smithellaceae bacterium]|nr:asparagine synthase-related protein [Smithellaceae bacterium]
MTSDDKLKMLKNIISGKDGLIVAFSGGVDSALLAKIAHDVLDEKAIAVTIDSPLMPRGELNGSRKLARDIGIRHIVLKKSRVEDRRFSANTLRRCYYCKKADIDLLQLAARKLGIKDIAFGATLDDLDEFRPGMRA